MIQQIRSMLSLEETEVVRSVFEIPRAEIDLSRTSIVESNSFVIVSVKSLNEKHCAFEFHFDRGSEASRFNFYFGLGAELHNYESMGDSEARCELAGDITRFLASSVESERVCFSDGTVASERYLVSGFVVSGVPTQFWFRGKSGFRFGRRTKELVGYRPWIASA